MTKRGHRELFGVMEIFFILLVVVVLGVYEEICVAINYNVTK